MIDDEVMGWLKLSKKDAKLVIICNNSGQNCMSSYLTYSFNAVSKQVCIMHHIKIMMFCIKNSKDDDWQNARKKCVHFLVEIFVKWHTCTCTGV